MLARASAHLDRNFIGIDRLRARLRRADKKILRAGLSNVRFVRIEASYAVDRLIPPDSISTVYVLFPDPWPKRRHHRRRLFNPDFLQSLNRIMTAGSILHVATDHRDYFDWITELLNNSKHFEEAEPLQLSPNERTNFEIQFADKGMEIHRCTYSVRLSEQETNP